MRARGLRLFAILAVAGFGWEAEAKELRLYNWPNYTAPQVITRFEAETGIHVIETHYDSYGELLKKLESGKSGYDLAIPAEYNVRMLIEAGLIEKVEAARLPGFTNVEEQWRSPDYDPRNEYSIPWHWGTTSLVVDTGRYKGDVDTLALMFDPPPEITGKIGVLGEGEEVIGMALRYLGLCRCSDDPRSIEKIEALLQRLVARAEIYGADDIIDRLSKSPNIVNMAWNGDAMVARSRRPALRYSYPREGVIVWSDMLVVPKGASNLAEAKAFMAFMMRPDIAALQSNHTRYANAIRGSENFLSDEMRRAPEIILPPTARVEFLQSCKASTYATYRAVWRKVLAGKGGAAQ